MFCCFSDYLDRMRSTLCTIFLTCSTLSGCATTGIPSQAVAESDLAAWIGKPVAAYAAINGAPTSSIAVDDKVTAFRWVTNGTSVGAVVPVGSNVIVAPPRTVECTVVFYAAPRSAGAKELRDFTITSYAADGC